MYIYIYMGRRAAVIDQTEGPVSAVERPAAFEEELSAKKVKTSTLTASGRILTAAAWMLNL